MADTIGGLFNIAALLKRAYDIYDGCKKAPEEIRLAVDHIHTLTITLEGVRSDLIDNPRSFLYQHSTSDPAQARKQNLKQHIMHCSRALARMERLLTRYHNYKHVSGWDKFRWTTEGKKEIADAKEDVVMATIMLNMFLSSQNLSVVGRLENMMEAFMKRLDGIENLKPRAGSGRGRSSSMTGKVTMLGWAISRWLKILQKCRRRRGGNNPKSRPPGTSAKRPKAVSRVNSGFTINKQRHALIQSFASNMVNAPETTETNLRRRTPSPDFHYIPGGSTIPSPHIIRRSSSMTRLLGNINAQAVKSRVQTEYLKCWKVGLGRLAFGPKTAPQFKPHQRGQMQLRKVAEVLKEASKYDNRGISEADKRVSLLLRLQNSIEKENRSGKQWYLLTARKVATDPGRTGMVSVEKAIVILVRRG